MSPETLAALSGLSAEDRALAGQQRICPVADSQLGSMGPPRKVDVNGTSVFICCEGCRQTLLADPEKYLAKLESAARQKAPGDNAPSSPRQDLPPIDVPKMLEPKMLEPKMLEPKCSSRKCSSRKCSSRKCSSRNGRRQIQRPRRPKARGATPRHDTSANLSRSRSDDQSLARLLSSRAAAHPDRVGRRCRLRLVLARRKCRSMRSPTSARTR